MTKQEVYDFLFKQGINYEKDEHMPVYNMEELKDIVLKYPNRDAKNLFVRDDKKRNYYLISVKGDKKTDLKKFRAENGLRALSFASDDDLMKYLKLTPGSVTPLGLLNDEEKKVEFFLDEELMDGSGIIGVHPNDNSATLWLKSKDLVSLIEKHGNKVHIVKI